MVPEEPSGDPVEQKLPDFRVRPDVPVTVPEYQPTEGPGPCHCSQLTGFSFCINPICMSMLESLLHLTGGLSKLSLVLYPTPLESYEDVHSTLHLGLLAWLHSRIKQLLCASGWASMVWFSANFCLHCGDQIFYDNKPILCPCYIPT
ncbi:hypothetical protein MG293_020822 [Ovis ammon polii]|uniref:Uncharacterized protein n=1 Tax=Ovis ammon polii TaxID=230172 RepID=A0AAD4TJX3_OVIAM|nr:hypothetical protein MG293_020822 [Ovis ammon polii]KAI4550011.1 hypothetical protein MJT46_019160 [Ovis ammon polii x Ovis aries]